MAYLVYSTYIVKKDYSKRRQSSSPHQGHEYLSHQLTRPSLPTGRPVLGKSGHLLLSTVCLEYPTWNVRPSVESPEFGTDLPF